MRAAAAHWILLLALLAGAPRAAQQPDAAAQVATVLAQAAREGRGGDELAAALAALGPEALPASFAALAQGGVQIDDLENGWVTLERRQTEAVLTAIRRLPPATVRGFLATVPPTASVPERAAALRILRESATTQDLDMCLALAADGERDVRMQLQRVLESVVAREPAAVTALGTRFVAQPPALYAPVLRAIGSAGSPAALQQLSELLERRPEADAVLLTEIARLGGILPQPIEPRVRTRVRTYLSSSDTQMLAMAVYAAGRMGDHDAAEQLVTLLDHEREHVRESSHKVLRELSGKHFPLEVARWESWYRSESEWFRRDAPFHEAELGSGSEYQVAAALRELALHQLYRHDIAPEIARCLQRSDQDIVRLACAVLGQLRSPTVLPELVDLLERGDRETAPAAERALERITGERRRGVEAWRELTN